ncbi:MAG: undecaprenyldiphospho-muramoylpentapeptide beta-N-acetylglucosaminyltransferase [Bacilli bacterium]|nr:undecaprenyldiphospho-muramoylpentapeptide beta-N-acetylglucosaminyltransferase [Bacilli bacterium]
MKVVISAGGTGGHIYPALAIINTIKEKEPDSEFLYIGTHNRMEKDIVPSKGIPFKSIEMYGFNKKNLFKNFKTIRCLFKAFKDSKKIIKEFNPDVVIGVGGYVTVPVIYSAKKLGYKTFLHEQNSLPGKSNKFLIKYCDLIGVSFPSSLELLPKDKTILTGNPCSEDALKASAVNKSDLGLSDSKKLVLIVMGSLGAGRVSDFLTRELQKFDGRDYEVLFITGKGSYDLVKKFEFPSNVKILPFYEGLTKVMKKTDLIVTRAGASTLSEIIALNVPSIIIPSPFVANNHQYINALDLVKKDAALMIEEKDLNDGVLFNSVDKLINDESALKNMKNNLSKLMVKNSAEVIYDNLKRIVDENSK